MKNWFNRLSGALFSLLILSSATAFAASPDFSSLGAVSDNAFDTSQARNGDTVTFTLTINVAEDSDGVGQVTFDVGLATGLTATFPAAGAATTHTATYAVPGGQDGEISVTGLTFINTAAEALVGVPVFPHTPTPNVTLDNTDPHVDSILRQAPVSSPTNSDTLVWRVTFSEDVQNVDLADFTITGTTATLGVAVVSASVYDITASGGDLAALNATATLSFAGGQNITDLAANTLSDTVPTITNDNTYVVDNTAPTVTETTAVVTPTNDTTPDVVINTDEAGTLIIGGSCGTSSSMTLGTGDTTITLTQVDNTKPLTAGTYADCTVQITDASGNANVATALTSFLVDAGDPTVDSILRQAPVSSPTNSDTLVWRVTFSEDVQNVDLTDFTITGTTDTLGVGVTNAAGQYEMPVVPNRTYLVDSVKMPRYKIKKQYLTSGAGDLVLDGKMRSVEDGFTQTGNQSRNFTLYYKGKILTITVHSFSGQANVSQTNKGVEIDSFGLITLIELSIKGVEIIDLGNNKYRINGASVQGPVTGSTLPNKGLRKVLGSSSGGGFSGMTRAQNSTKGRVLTPEESMAFIKTLNEGSAGQTLYYLNSNGKKVFAGYINGRLSMVVFKKNSRTPIVYRGYRRTRQTYGKDQASVSKNQVALNEAINKNKMLQKKKVKSVSIGNRYESLRRKMAASGKTLKPFINRKQTTRDMILSLKNRNRMVAAKQYEFARSNGFTHTESRISQNRQAKQAEKLKIIESKEGGAKIFKEMKQERMEAFSFQGKSN